MILRHDLEQRRLAEAPLGDAGSNEVTLTMRMNYARACCNDPGAALDDLREGVTTLEEIERTARRVFGGYHPFIRKVECILWDSRAALRARETPPTKGES